MKVIFVSSELHFLSFLNRLKSLHVFLVGNSSELVTTRCECCCVAQHIDWPRISGKVKEKNGNFPYLFHDKRILHNIVTIFQDETLSCVHTTTLNL